MDLPQLTVDAQITVYPVAGVSVVLPQLTVAAQVAVCPVAEISIDLPVLWMASSVSLNIIVPLPQLALTALPGRVAPLAMALPMSEIQMTGGVYDLAMTLPALTCALSMEPPTVIEMSLPALQSGIVGVNGRAGAVGMRMPRATGDFTGGVFGLTMSVPPVLGVFSAQAVQLAALTAELPHVSCALSANVSRNAVSNLSLPKLQYAGTAVSTLLCNLQIQVPPLVGAYVGAVGSNAPLQAALPALQISAAAYSQISGNLVMTMSRLGGAFRAEIPTAQIATLVVNTITNSTVTYEQYPYNSFAEFNGMYLAAGPGGLYQIETGDLDGAAPILSSILTGELTLSSEQQKRVVSIYVGMRSENALSFSVTTDENETASYPVDPYNVAVIKARRAIVGKGLRGKYWQFGVKNDGGDFGIDSISITAVPTSRRI